MREFLLLLQRHGVEFVVCGGHAVAFHGYPRLTMDLDILVRPSEDNADRVMAALAEFGFGNAGIPRAGFVRRGTAVTLGAQPNQIDLHTSIGHSDDESVFARGESGDLDGVEVRYVAFSDLVLAKREAGRPKDLADLDELTRIHSPPPTTN
jgi:predicted nucleotidyltransferase